MFSFTPCPLYPGLKSPLCPLNLWLVAPEPLRTVCYPYRTSNRNSFAAVFILQMKWRFVPSKSLLYVSFRLPVSLSAEHGKLFMCVGYRWHRWTNLHRLAALGEAASWRIRLLVRTQWWMDAPVAVHDRALFWPNLWTVWTWGHKQPNALWLLRLVATGRAVHWPPLARAPRFLDQTQTVFGVTPCKSDVCISNRVLHRNSGLAATLAL